ncbi:MAG: LptF/LptG family permease [Candidatus Omnitrophota bacterium]|nr:MAG: LptF/LptG family permease [Candidatus Omnitrophota bacterium]
MKLIRNYILKDFLTAFVFSLLLLSMVMLLGNMVKISDMVIRKGVSLIDALKIFFFFAPYLLGFTLPLSFLMGVLLAMGRIITDNEIIPIKMAGIPITKILNIFLMIGIIFSLFLFILNDRIIPNFHYHYRNQIKNIYSKNISSLIEPGIFLDSFQSHILYVSGRDGNKLKNVFIYEVDNKKDVSKVIFAKRAEFITEGNILKMKLEEGFRDENNPDNKKELYRMNFKIFFIDIPIEEKKKVQVEKKAADMPLTELKEKIQQLQKLGINPVEMKGEFHKRISFSFSVLAFILLGFGVSLIIKHREKSINFGIAFVGGIVYYLLFILVQTLIENRLLFPAIGMWLPNIIIGSIGGILLKKYAHSR